VRGVGHKRATDRRHDAMHTDVSLAIAARLAVTHPLADLTLRSTM
jgi:hypothetical protein